MKLQMTPHDFDTILKLRQPMPHLSLNHRHEQELAMFYDRLAAKLVDQGVGGKLARGLLTNASDCRVTVDIESYEVENYHRIATDLEKPFPSAGLEIEAYYNGVFHEWRDMTRDWVRQAPDRHLPE
jgi:hypothetical protein